MGNWAKAFYILASLWFIFIQAEMATTSPVGENSLLGIDMLLVMATGIMIIGYLFSRNIDR